MNKQKELAKRHLGVGASSLKDFEIDPLYFKNKVDGLVKEETASFLELGTKLHMYILEPDEFKQNYIYLECPKPRNKNQVDFCEMFVNSITPDINIHDLVVEIYKNIYSTKNKSEAKLKEEALKLYKSMGKYIDYLGATKDYKEVLTWSDISYLRMAKQKAMEHVMADNMLFDKYDPIYEDNIETYNEEMIYWEYPDIQIEDKPLVLRSTIDRMTIDHDKKIINLIDVKTTSVLHEFGESFDRLKYYRQLSLYWLAIEYWFADNFPDLDFKTYQKETHIAAVQTPNRFRDFPIRWKIFPISETKLEEGSQSLKKALNDIKWHVINDKWEHSRNYYENTGLEEPL